MVHLPRNLTLYHWNVSLGAALHMQVHKNKKNKKNKNKHLTKVVLNAADSNSIFKEFHCSCFGGHCRVENTQCHYLQVLCCWMLENNICKWVSWRPQTLLLTHVLLMLNSLLITCGSSTYQSCPGALGSVMCILANVLGRSMDVTLN